MKFYPTELKQKYGKMNYLLRSVAYPSNQTLSSVREGAEFLCLSQVLVAGSGPGTSCSLGEHLMITLVIIIVMKTPAIY